MTRFAEGRDDRPEERTAPAAEPNPTVGRIVFDALGSYGVSHVFCVPGESYLGLLDAFHGSGGPTLVTTRHEEGAGVMAEAQARLTGRPGVAMVTRGPGVTHLSIAIHTAMQDGVPLVGFVGQVPTRLRGRGAFQEVEVAHLGKTLGKWGVEIDHPERAPELVARAFEVALAGRPGPVLVSVPEDVGSAPVESSFTAGAAEAVQTFDGEPVRRAAATVHAAPSVALVVGDAVRRAGAGPALDRLASTLGAPVYTAWRQYDAFPNDHRLYAGPLPWLPAEMLRPLRDARVLLVVGTRLDDFSSLHYTLPGPEQELVSLDASGGEPPHQSAGAVHVGGDLRLVLEKFNDALTALGPAAGGEGEPGSEAHAAYLATRRAPDAPGVGIDLGRALADLRSVLPADTVTTSDAGAFTGFVSRYFSWTRPGTFLGPVSGAMAYAVPAAIGAKLLDPSRPVAAFVGDGGFAMVMSEVETAVRLGLGGLLFLVFDNRSYGAIRRDQRRRFPGREVGVELGPIDFARVAEAMGAAGYRAQGHGDLLEAVRSALSLKGPAVIHVPIDPAQIEVWPAS